jgi:hypothetical protein
MTMVERNGIEQIVERVVSLVLESHVPQLRRDLVQRVLDELPPELGQLQHGASVGSSPANLLKAISAIHVGTTQKEILRALLDNTVRYSGRAALFIIKSGSATGWQGRGFANNEDVKEVALDVNTGVASRALQSRMAFAGSATDIDPRFVSRFGAPADDQVLVLPLLLKDKVAALVYADSGVEAGGNMEAAALEVLVLATSAWLEVAALRKQALKEVVAEAGVVEKSEPAPSRHPVSSVSDPFAAHAPKHAVAMEIPVAAEHAAAAAAGAAVEAHPAPISSPDTAPATASDEFAQMPPEDAEIHRKAQRFARLLVDEIKLYNQAKVAEGRKNKDLYDRLKEDIEKSRATFQKRYGNTVAAGADYFSHELLRSLAEDDSSIMGAHFRR